MRRSRAGTPRWHACLPAAAVDVIISTCVFTLSTDMPRALAEVVRVLRPGGRYGVTDVLAEPGLSPARRGAAEHAVGCPLGTLVRTPESRVLDPDQDRAQGYLSGWPGNVEDELARVDALLGDPVLIAPLISLPCPGSGAA